MALQGGWAEFDERLEAGFALIGPGVVLAHPMLSDVEARKVESDVSLVWVKCVDDAGLVERGLQPHPCQPGY